MVIYDCTYTDKEFEGKIGWGHSTWQEGVRLSKAANVKNLVIFHGLAPVSPDTLTGLQLGSDEVSR